MTARMVHAVWMLAALLMGCTHTRLPVVQPQAYTAWSEQVNRDVGNRAVDLVFIDGVRVRAQGVRIVGETVSWQRVGTLQMQTSRVAVIREISFRSRRRGARDGLMIGFAIGAPAGALISDPAGGRVTFGDRVGAALAGGIGFAVWGAAIGAIRGSRIVYQVGPPQSDADREAPLETEQQQRREAATRSP